MTKIALLSDLHVEHHALSPGYGVDFTEIRGLKKTDIFCIPGDIADGIDEGRVVLEYIARLTRAQIVFVMGNHDYLHHDLDRSTVELMRSDLPANVHVLDNEALIIDRVRILGCTLWTDLIGYDESDSLYQVMPDYSYIYAPNGELITPSDTQAAHVRSVEFLSRELATPFDGKTIMMSHHAPSNHSRNRKKQDNDVLAPFFYSDLDHLIKKYQPDLVLHGHTHYPVDYHIDTSRVIHHPMPKPDEPVTPNNPLVGKAGFAPKIIRI